MTGPPSWADGRVRWRCVDCGRQSDSRPEQCPDCASERLEQIRLY